MAGQNDFLIFDENADNMLTQELYASDEDRTDGFKTGLARSNVTNKVLYQTSKMCHAIGEVAKDQDLIASDSSDIAVLKNVVKNALGGANKELSNLNSEGEKHFLNKQQVTNCLLEVPNNIKLELENGVLTLKAGSKVIVPNGFEEDGVTPKFDEVTIESDMTNNETHSNEQTVMVWLNSARDGIGTRPITMCYSGSTRPSGQTAMVWYNTNNNIIENTINGGSTWATGQSLPFCIATVGSTGFTSINQIFNGFGYIGSTVWADKGIKGLIPNGRNTDGSLNNTEYTTENITVRNTDPTSNYQHFLIMRESQPSIVTHGSGVFSYDPEQNYNFYSPQDVKTIYSGLIAGTLTLESGQITGFTINNALNINSMCDGQWVTKSLTLAENVTAPTTNDIEYDLSKYLPKDGYNYEVFVLGRVATPSTSGAIIILWISSSLIGSAYVCQAVARTAATVQQRSSVILPVGADRKLNVLATTGATGTFYLYLRGYRRIGTNF